MVYPYVYILTHNLTGQFYIGGRFANKHPPHVDLGKYYFSSSKLIKEMGFDNFNATVFAIFFDAEDAYRFEQELIYEYFKINEKCLNRCCRHIINGNQNSVRYNPSGTKLTKAHKDKISKSNKGKRRSNETKELIKQLNIGRKHTKESRDKMSCQRKGHITSNETRQKISKANKGKIRTIQQRKSLSCSLKGRTISEETKQKMRNNMKKRFCVVEKHSNETKEKMRQAKLGKFLRGDSPSAKKIILNGIIYNCVQDAADALCVSYSYIINRLTGKCKLNSVIWEVYYPFNHG